MKDSLCTIKFDSSNTLKLEAYSLSIKVNNNKKKKKETPAKRSPSVRKNFKNLKREEKGQDW